MVNDVSANNSNRASTKRSNSSSTNSKSSSSKKVSRMSTNSISSSSNLSNFEENNGDYDKEKHKLYAGISSKFIKCSWEQHNRGNDLDIAPEVFSKLSEDVSYKLWELANSIKTYSRHCGGYVTADLVNDVLKDANVPPVLGASNLPWDKIETDRAYYFQTDEVVDLSKEYTAEMKDEQCEEMLLTTSWTSTSNPGDLKNFADRLCNAIFNGFEDVYELGIELTQNDPNIGCILKLLLQEVSRKLIEDYTSESLGRCLRFIDALAYNPYTRDAAIEIDLITLAELMLCVILGPHKRHRKFEMEQDRVKQENKLIKRIKLENESNVSSPESVVCDPAGLFEKTEDPDNFVRIYKDFYRRTTQSQTGDNKDTIKLFDSNPTSQQIGPVSVSQEYDGDHLLNLPNDMLVVGSDDQTSVINEIDDPEFENFVKNECEELFATFEEIRKSNSQGGNTIAAGQTFDGFSIKKESEHFESEQSISLDNSISIHPVADEIKVEAFNPGVPSNNSSTTINKDLPPISREIINYIKIYTKMCKTRSLMAAITTLGNACAQWGYFEKIVSVLLRIRCQKFFEDDRPYAKAQYDWIVRAIYALWAVGEESLRNFFCHIQRIDPLRVPEQCECHFAVIATFLRGSDDANVYAWLYQIVGDKLQPNMITYGRKLKALSKKYVERSRPATERIRPKLLLKSLPMQMAKKTTLRSIVFDESVGVRKFSVNRTKINFRFPGCRPPVTIKSKKIIIKIEKPEPRLCETVNFRQRIVVGRRKLLSTLSNEVKPRKFYSIVNFNL